MSRQGPWHCSSSVTEAAVTLPRTSMLNIALCPLTLINLQSATLRADIAFTAAGHGIDPNLLRAQEAQKELVQLYADICCKGNVPMAQVTLKAELRSKVKLERCGPSCNQQNHQNHLHGPVLFQEFSTSCKHAGMIACVLACVINDHLHRPRFPPCIPSHQ